MEDAENKGIVIFTRTGSQVSSYGAWRSAQGARMQRKGAKETQKSRPDERNAHIQHNRRIRGMTQETASEWPTATAYDDQGQRPRYGNETVVRGIEDKKCRHESRTRRKAGRTRRTMGNETAEGKAREDGNPPRANQTQKAGAGTDTRGKAARDGGGKVRKPSGGKSRQFSLEIAAEAY